MQKEYSIGLDIGTTSVGWAVIDQNFKIIRKGNQRKALWGVRLFDEADTAEKRRLSRSTRRRYDRRRERIKLLQEIFHQEINRVDPDFFQKLKESFYNQCEEKEINFIKVSLEEKKQYLDYRDKYKTIYHLRNELIENSSKKDIRLVYLAIHHIIKYRGNFNYNIDNFNINNFNTKSKLEEIFNTFLIVAKNATIYNEIDNINFNNIENIFLIETKNERKKELEKEFKLYFTNKVCKELAKAFVGYKFNLNCLLAIENETKIELEFDNDDFDNKLESTNLKDEIELVYLIKALYDIISLKYIFKNEKDCSISKLMVKYHKIQNDDLHKLKNLLRPYRDEFKELFKNKENKICKYELYIKNKLSYYDFTTHINKILDTIINNENQNLINSIKLKIEKGNYLPRITDIGNGKYPYQINEAELKIIINNQKQYYPFLDEIINGENKIVKLLKFKIPYYVGPLNKNTKLAWLERKDNVKITPFNFEDVVDIHKSAVNFIENILGHCTYLLHEFQIPNNSILYSKFKVLNELKQIKINGRSINLDLNLMHKIYEEFFMKTKGSLTDSKFKNYLRTCDEASMYIDKNTTDIDVTGYSAFEKFANNMNSYLDFFGEDGIFINTNLTIQDAEDIIRILTIFKDQEIKKKEILTKYPTLKEKIMKILSLKYKGWSGLSKELLLTAYYSDEETGIKKSIMDLMWETTENFMQILSNSKYNFQEMIKEKNGIKKIKNNYDLVKDLATSPATKRGIYQSIKVIQEIVDYMGYEPKFVSIEMSRSNDKKVRTVDRKKQLLIKYDNNKGKIDNYKYLNSKLKKYEKIDDKLLLYFLQEGKCLYSKESIDINRLNEYDIDHIIPQALIKDDSIDNKVLVKKELNEIKSASLILPLQFRNNSNLKWWKHLYDLNLISRKKYNNLVRSKFTDKDVDGFISRQLVETRQITKHVANIISTLYSNTKVIYIKSSVSHNYREKFKLYKYRDLNDYHHAHDAYLAVVLGVYQRRYLKTKINKFELNSFIDRLKEEKNFKELKYGYVINSINQCFIKENIETGEILNIKDFIETIENTLYRNDILISKKTEIKTGEFYNKTIQSKGKSGVPLKKNLSTNLYGSYTSLNPSYAILVKYQKKKKENQKMIGIPIYIVAKNNSEILLNYIKDLLNIEDINNIKIIKDKIPFYTTLNWNGQICFLVGANDKVEICNAQEFKFEREKQIIWKNALNRLFNNRTKACEDIVYNNQLCDIINYVILKIEKEYELYKNLLPELKNILKVDVPNLNMEFKEKLLLQLFKLLKCNSATADLKFLNTKYSSSFGRKNDKTINNAVIIMKSTTGLKEKKYEF